MRNLTSTDRHRQNRAFRPMRNAAAMKWSLSSRPSPLQRGGRGCSRAACCRASRPITRRRAPTPIDPGARCGRDQMARADDGEANDAIARLAGSPHEPTVAWPADRHRRHAAPPIPRSAAHRATLLLGGGAQPKIVSEMLGHTQTGITWIWTRACPLRCSLLRWWPWTGSLAVRTLRRSTKVQASPRSSGDRASVS
jgi:hypothetical protein